MNGRTGGWLVAATGFAVAGSLLVPAGVAAAHSTTAQTVKSQVKSASSTARQASSTGKLRVATYNVCKVDCPSSPLSWSNRREAVFRTMKSSKADLIALQETNSSRSGNSQRGQIARALSKAGYDLFPKGHFMPVDADCSGPCVRTTGILAKRDVLRSVSLPSGEKTSGMVSLKSLTGQSWGPSLDRSFAWALLEHIPTGQPVLISSVHLVNEKTNSGETSRRASAAAVVKWLQDYAARIGMPNTPLFVAGDLNSFQKRNPKGAQVVLEQAGFVDGFRVKRRINSRYPTVNHAFGSSGWPTRPPIYNREAPRIDYVFGSRDMRPVKYGVHIKKLRNGKFNPKFRGSDHNLVWSDWLLP